MWLLTIEDDEGLTTFHRLTRDRYTLGRAPGNDLVLAQLDVSRRHARLERHAGGWRLIDENSRVGSFLNAMRVRGQAPVGDGDIAQIGGYLLRFSTTVPTGVPTPPPRYVAPARLRALVGPLAGEEHIFPRGETITIGASDDCTLRVLDDRVSVVHALFLPLAEGRHEIVDKSHNGLLFVNGRRVPGRQVLEGGDAINVGGITLFRYLEPSQQPDPRFDAVWAQGAEALAFDASYASAPALRAARSSAPRVPEGDEASNDARVESAGPCDLPPRAPPSASFERLRQATLGRGGEGGSERAFVVERVAPPTPAAAANWYVGAPLDGVRPARGLAPPQRPPPSGRSLVAFETLVDERASSPHGRGRAPEADDTERPDEESTPRAETMRAPPRRQWSALLYPVAIAAVLGATVALQATWPGMPPPMTAPASASEVAPAAPTAATAAVLANATPDPAPPTSVVTAATSVAPSVPASRDEPIVKSRSVTRRAALEARAQGGRASIDELNELLSLCHVARDARCVVTTRARLGGASKGR